MNILLTGSTGFVGHTLADALTRYALRNEVWAIDPHRPGPTALLMPAAQAIARLPDTCR